MSLRLLFGALCATVAFAACSADPPGGAPPEQVGVAESRAFANGDFDAGDAGSPPPSWTVQSFLNSAGLTVQSPQTRAGLNLADGGVPLTTEIFGGDQPDPDLGSGASLRLCRYGVQCARLNFHGSGQNVNSLSQTMTVGPSDLGSDGQVHVRFVRAAVLQDPGHAPVQRPYYFIQLTKVATGAALYTELGFVGSPAGFPWKVSPASAELYYTDWTLVDIGPPLTTGLVSGDGLKLELIASGCSLGDHFGELYVDSVGETLPGLFVSGSAASPTIGAGADLVYTLNYQNGAPATPCFTSADCPQSPSSVCSAGDAGADDAGTEDAGAEDAGTGGAGAGDGGAGGAGAGDAGSPTQHFCAETTVVIDFTTPTNTTYQSITPPTGANCSTPAQGLAGIVTCAFTNPVPLGSSGSFTVTVNVDENLTSAGAIVASDYGVRSDQETRLLGSQIITPIACTTDAQCAAGNWCNGSTCTPMLENGGAPDGGCDPDVAALVCQSGVCDSDGACGYKNADGPCTQTNGAVVCRSGVCDPHDNACGYAAGDGPCVPGMGGNGTTVCRANTVCAGSGTCQTVGACTTDADCGGAGSGFWCNVPPPPSSPGVCTPTLGLGQTVPIDVWHGDPPLVGICFPGVGELVCTSTVCDTLDNACGYAAGDGPCDAGTVCRSQLCSGDGKCLAQTGGCNVDSDCAGTSPVKWCNETSNTCTPELSNGTPLPPDPRHTDPTLNGTCTAAAAALVCQSGVCDNNDDACGYQDGDGPCTPQNGATVCRSTLCSGNGRCLKLGTCNVDGDCAPGQWCNETMNACEAALGNGQAIPKDPAHTSPTLDGTCSAAAGTVVCSSGVCDTHDNACGYAAGDGPCTASDAGPVLVCRSGVCSSDGRCLATGTQCDVDGDCTGGAWCDETLGACMGLLDNGAPLPSDGQHQDPTLAGKCSVTAALLVCQSGVCDPADDQCGYAAGDGSCTPSDAGPVSVCRSGTCSVDGHCMVKGGCNTDGDCTGGAWCNEGLSTCTPPLPNGAPIPTDGKHGDPTLAGTCTTMAAVLVCASGVCDTHDAKCGYAAGDGPCAASDAGPVLVCRSGACSSDGLCLPSGGACYVDGDCAAGSWCNETLGACTPQLAQGVSLPVDTKHTGLTLDGTCTTAAALLVCKSGACDVDSRCGIENSDGPCTQADGATVCRSGVCDADNRCGFASGDGPCTQADSATVCRSGVCGGDGNCGLANGVGPCAPTDDSSVCRATACDTDGKCGLLDGTCADGDGAVCRSGVCDFDGKCCNPSLGPCRKPCHDVSQCAQGEVCNLNNECEPAGEAFAGGGGGCSLPAGASPEGPWWRMALLLGAVAATARRSKRPQRARTPRAAEVDR